MTRNIPIVGTILAHLLILSIWHHPYWYVVFCLTLIVMLLMTFTTGEARRKTPADRINGLGAPGRGALVERPMETR
ncbi:hypothetical protein [Tabrizicola sp. M-4]|uniref:hypothetical protein n=1 Tax=Tabrizicola sp. M-4 TaxID=3055847 RepID=UPI003DA9699E